MKIVTGEAKQERNFWAVRRRGVWVEGEFGRVGWVGPNWLGAGLGLNSLA